MLFDELVRGTARHQPLFELTTDYEREAAVLIPLYRAPSGLELILTKRSEHMSTHAGEVAFPGGIKDAGDRDHYATALREAREEIALPEHRVKIAGALSPLVSRYRVKVVPVVGFITELPELRPNPDEISSIFRVPLGHFNAQNVIHRREISYQGKHFMVPEYQYQDYKIWGMTSFILTDFLSQCLAVDIDLGI